MEILFVIAKVIAGISLWSLGVAIALSPSWQSLSQNKYGKEYKMWLSKDFRRWEMWSGRDFFRWK